MKRTILQFVVCSLLLAACLCSQKAYAICDEPTGAGAVFNDFDKIIIYFAGLPSQQDQDRPDYPDAIKPEIFKKQVHDAVKETFLPCLGSEGHEKSVELANELNERMYQKQNLVLFVRLIFPYSQINQEPETVYGMLQTAVFRPGLPSEDAILTFRNNMNSFAFFPHMSRRVPLKEELDTNLRIGLRPIKHPMRLDNNEDEFWDKVWKNQK